MKKLLSTILLGFGLVSSALANDPALERFLEKQVQSKLETCVDTISQVETIGNRYFVVYTVAGSYDQSFGCSGNATWSNLAELTYHNGRYSVVNLNVLENQNFTYIENMDISDDGIATLDTLAYGSKDSQHHPRDKYRVKIRLVDMKVLSNQFIGRKSASD